MSTKEYFDKAAVTWDKQFCNRDLSSFLEKLVPRFRLKYGQRVLDVGTGTGVLIPHLVKAVGSAGSVIAIDYSGKMAQICKTKHSNLRNFNMTVGNIEEYIFPAETFDAVICFGVFPHLQKKQKVLENINCILKSDGKIIIAHALSSEELKIHHKKVSEYLAYAVMPKKVEMVKLLKQTGFKQISLEDKPGCYLCMASKL